MERLAVLAILHAKPGREQAVEDFLRSALPLVQAETGTASWYALKLAPATFGIFDTFADQDGRESHLTGAVAASLFGRADDLFTATPTIGQAEILVMTSRAR